MPIETGGPMYGHILDKLEALFVRARDQGLVNSHGGYLCMADVRTGMAIHSSRVARPSPANWEPRKRIAERQAQMLAHHQHMMKESGGEPLPSHAERGASEQGVAILAYGHERDPGGGLRPTPIILGLAIGESVLVTEALLIAVAIEAHLLPLEDIQSRVVDGMADLLQMLLHPLHKSVLVAG